MKKIQEIQKTSPGGSILELLRRSRKEKTEKYRGEEIIIKVVLENFFQTEDEFPG